MADVSFLITIYSVLLLFYVLYFIFSYQREKNVNAIVIVRGMYILIYCIVPLFSFIAIINSGSPEVVSECLSLSEKGVSRLTLFPVLSCIGFIALEIGNKTRFVTGHSGERIFKKPFDPSERSLWVSSLIMLVISLIAFYMWSKPFGGLAGIIKYGTFVRSGYSIGEIKNTYGFMKHFVPLAQFCSIICIALCTNRFSFKYFLISVVSIIESWFYLVANDGRAPFMMYFVSIFATIYIVKKRKETSREHSPKKIVALIVILLIGLFIIENADGLMGLARGSSSNSLEANRISFDFLIKEFSFTLRNEQTVFEAKEAGVGLRLFMDLLSAVFAILPSRFTPNGVYRLEAINTYYFAAGRTSPGGCPTDIIVTGLYELGVLGVFILPFVYGLIIRRFDEYYAKSQKSLYSAIIYTQLLYQFVKTVAYADLALVTLNLFYIIVGHIIVKVIGNNSQPKMEMIN